MYSRDDWEDLLNSVAEDHAVMIRQLLTSEDRLRTERDKLQERLVVAEALISDVY